ncbi:MAG TPA: hypothetical protein VNB22_11575 [Pyrinomonadaceae bacterium]|nr:hypothetical protein [Pyrinomonadaceae bacterium]
MPDENVNKWKQKGHLYLWHYIDNTRNYPGWNLTADKTFCDSFADLIQRMLVAQYNCQQPLMITLPTKKILGVPNNQGGQAGWKSPKTIVLKHLKDKIADDYFFFEESENTAILAVGRQNLELLKGCVLKISEGKGDYSIEIGSTQLWFWWML